jgi:hypothetical protein
MRVGRLLCCITALAAFVAFAAPSARADEYNKLTYLTFSSPVQLPGTTLAAGTYMFKLADTMAERHIVQVFDKNGGKLYATLLAIPDYRIDAPDKNVVLFAERPAGTPQAVKAWWYPGDTTGEEFVYPKAQAMKLARANHASVLASGESINDRGKMKSARVGRVNERGETTAENAAPAAAAKTATTTADRKTATGTSGSKTPTTTDRGSKSTTARSNANPSNATSSTTSTSRRSLPRTASPLGLIELLSIAAFAGAAGTRQLRRRLAGGTA